MLTCLSCHLHTFLQGLRAELFDRGATRPSREPFAAAWASPGTESEFNVLAAVSWSRCRHAVWHNTRASPLLVTIRHAAWQRHPDSDNVQAADPRPCCQEQGRLR